MSVDRIEGKPPQNEARWISQAFVILHGASLIAAFGFLAETWGRLTIWLLQIVVTTGWVHFIGVAYSLCIIHLIENRMRDQRALPRYHLNAFIIPAFLLLGGWALVGFALTYAAWCEDPTYYYRAGKLLAPH